MNDRETENLLSRALDTRARTMVTEDRPLPILRLDSNRVRPLHRRWSMPLLAAAAAVAVVAASTLGARALVAHHAHPAATQPPVSSSPAPIPSPTPTPTSSATHTAAARASSPHSTPAIPPTTIQLPIGSITVPASWALASAAPVGTSCLTVGGIPFQGNGVQNNCELWIRQFDGVTGNSTLARGVVDPDRPGGAGATSLCAGGDSGISMDVLTQPMLGAVLAEYREFSGVCIQQRLQQWVVPTGPAIVITRFDRPAGSDAAARQAVLSLKLSGNRTSMRLVDRGYVLSTTRQANQPWLLTIARSYQRPDGQNSFQQQAIQASYPQATMESPSGLIRIHYYSNGKWTDISEVGLSYLLAHIGFSNTLPPIERMVADVTTDGHYVIDLVLHVPTPN